MQAALMTEAGTISVESLPDPTPDPTGVVVEVAAVGICGTDLHVLRGEHGVRPVVPGHELSGTVVAVGADVTSIRVGDRVAVDPNLPCHGCPECHRGRGNLCSDLHALGIDRAGAAADFMAAPAANCVVLPDSIDLETAALIEPLSCVVHGFDVLRLNVGASVLIYGAGTMGLMMLAFAQRAGARSVDVVELDETRRSRAATLGCSSATSKVEEGEWDVVIDTTGSPAAIQDGLSRLATGGTFLQFGVTSPDATVTIAPYDIYRRELTILGSMAVLHSFERAAQLVAAGFLEPSIFLTDRYPLADYATALEQFAAGAGVKTLILPSR